MGVVRYQTVIVALGVLAVGGCGKVSQAPGATGKQLCFNYFQQCVAPVLDNVQTYGGLGTNTCSTGGDCHGILDSAGNPVTSRGGKFQIYPQQTPIAAYTPNLSAPDTRFVNFASASGSSNVGDPFNSNLIRKPLVQVFHGGGQIFVDANAPGIAVFVHWMSHGVDDGFSAVECDSLYTSPPAVGNGMIGAC